MNGVFTLVIANYKMKKKTIIVMIGFALIFVGWANPLDLGVPPINAVCKIKLTNGTQIEGMICIVNGGYSGYQKNGFGTNYPDSEYFNYKMFSVTDYVFGNGGSSRVNGETGERQYPDKYFMAFQYGGVGNQTSTFNDTTMIHSINVSTAYSYLALKDFDIYEELPLSLNLPRQGGELQGQGAMNLKKRKISVDDIEEFKLLENPNEKWINIIQETKDRLRTSSNDWVDYQEPLWYHEIRNDSALFHNLKVKLGSESVLNPCK